MISSWKRKLAAAAAIALAVCGLGVRSDAVTPARGPDYDLAVLVQPDGRRLEVSGTLRLPPAAAARDTLRFRLSPLLSNFQVELTEPSRIEGPATVLPPDPGADSTLRLVVLRRTAPAGTPLVLRFGYSGGEISSPAFSIAEPVAFACGNDFAWYPQLEGGRGLGTGSLRFTVPAGKTVVAMGSAVGSVSDAKDGRFRFGVRDPLHFSFAVGEFHPVRRSGVPAFSGYFLRPRPGASDSVLAPCARVFDTLTRQFGESGYGPPAIVEVPAEGSLAGFQGASAEGLLLVSGAHLERPFEIGIFAHELSRQWWGMRVRPGDAPARYLVTEALPRFSALLVIESLEGEAAAERFRRGDAEDGGRAYLLRSAAGFDQPLVELTEADDPLALSRTKGALVFDLLSRTVGPDRFRAGLRSVLREHALGAVTWDELRRAIESAAGRDLDWFFRQWFERTGAPEWDLTWNQEKGSLKLAVQQAEPTYQADVDVLIDGTGGERVMRSMHLKGKRSEATLPVAFPVASVSLDPHFRVLHWTSEGRAEALAISSYLRAEKLRAAGKLEGSETELCSGLGKIAEPDLYGARFALEYGLTRVLFDRGKPQEARTHAEAALRCPTRRKELLPWLYYGFAQIAKQANDGEALRWAVQSAQTADAVAGGRRVPARLRGLWLRGRPSSVRRASRPGREARAGARSFRARNHPRG